MEFTSRVAILFTDKYLCTVFGYHIGSLTWKNKCFDVYNLSLVCNSWYFIYVDIYLGVCLSAMSILLFIYHSPVLCKHLNTIQKSFKWEGLFAFDWIELIKNLIINFWSWLNNILEHCNDLLLINSNLNLQLLLLNYLDFIRLSLGLLVHYLILFFCLHNISNCTLLVTSFHAPLFGLFTFGL